MPRLIRRLVMTVTALLLALGPVLGLTPLVSRPVAAFYPDDMHIPAFRAQLGDRFSTEAVEWVVKGLDESDYLPGQLRPEWHFDSANDAAAICDRWSKGPKALLDASALAAVDAFRRVPGKPDDPAQITKKREEALRAYGQYLHAIQDFYAHTNWIELHVAAGQRPDLAPIGDGCDASTLQSLAPGLRSGYFDADTPPDFCGPRTAARPPVTSGSTICHGPPNAKTIAALLAHARNALSALSWLPASGSTAGMSKDLVEKEQALAQGSTLPPNAMLAKDVQNEWHGNQTFSLPDGTTMKYYDEAVRLATLATPETFPVFQRWVVAKLTTDVPDRDPECLFRVLIMGGDPACPKRFGPGGHYQGDVPIADEQVAARITYPPGFYKSLHDLHVDLQLDATTNSVLGGSLSYEAFLDDPPTARRHVYTLSTAESVGPFVVLPGGILGRIAFRGETINYYPDGGDSGSSEHGDFFLYASDQAGRVVLCADDDSLETQAKDLETQRQECVARAFIELQPVQTAA